MEQSIKPLGIVLCGGQSSRMGNDKAHLVYNGEQQALRVCDLLNNICREVKISLSATQAGFEKKKDISIIDLPEFAGQGPMAGLLTAFKLFPSEDILLIGCDYPFLSKAELELFIFSINKKFIAHTFYNDREKLYEPMLGWYSSAASPFLFQTFREGNHSLQSFLKKYEAGKYYPRDLRSIISVDDPLAYALAKEELG